MKDICVDEDGNLRCASCGGKNFHGRRTARAHVIGYVTVGVGALATQKKLRCQECGAYNKQGNAQPWRETQPTQPILSKFSQSVRIDDAGDLHCWNCGFSEFVEPHPLAPAVSQQDRCARCKKPNILSERLPWEGPASDTNWD